MMKLKKWLVKAELGEVACKKLDELWKLVKRRRS